MLEFNTSKRNKAIIHLMASTDVRIEIHNYSLQMQYIQDVGNDGCMTILIYAGESNNIGHFLSLKPYKII